MLHQGFLYGVHFMLREAKVLSQTCWPCRTVQFKDGLMPVPNDMNVRRPMVIRVDGNAKTWQPQDSRHRKSVANRIAWVMLDLLRDHLTTSIVVGGRKQKNIPIYCSRG